MAQIGCTTAPCPFRLFSFLHSCRAAKSVLYEPGFYEPAIGDLNLPAMKGHCDHFPKPAADLA
jgi:hypothetical protein